MFFGRVKDIQPKFLMFKFFWEGQSKPTLIFKSFKSFINRAYVVKHPFEGLYDQTSAVLAGRPAAGAELTIRIEAETEAIYIALCPLS